MKKLYLILPLFWALSLTLVAQTYKIVGTNQSLFYNTTTTQTAPSSGQAFYGQDATYPGNVPSYTNNGDGTVSDNISGLMWQQTEDRTGDGLINYYDKMTYAEAAAAAASCTTGGYHDWRLPTIKELYSLALFSGAEVNPQGTTPGSAVLFIDTNYFHVGYGDLSASAHGALANNRIIDGQIVSSTLYVSTTMGSSATVFGFNFCDGRIKGYPSTASVPEDGQTKHFYVLYVRGNPNYGINNFTNNGNGTLTDNATGLMWMQTDNGVGVLWEDALSYAENFTYAGYSDWRLPDAKELQSIVDYSRSPATTGSPAINSMFSCTQITNEAGVTDYPYYWSSTTFCSLSPTNGTDACYFSFGRALGYMASLGGWIDVHGAGAQRSDPKTGNPANYPTGHGPQGDAVRIYNYARLVRDAAATGYNEIKDSDKVKVFPNPVKDCLTIKTTEPAALQSILIYDVLGQLVLQQNTTSTQTRVDVSKLTNGLYILKNHNKEACFIECFVKE